MADSNINHKDSLNYWEGIDADVNGMLGGFPYISKVDLQGSKNFLAKLGVGGKTGEVTKVKRVVDCGAGIGRITEGLLLEIAGTVDIVEPIAKFTNSLKGKQGIGTIFNTGLEGWNPDPEIKYDIIWNQWCLGHLTDTQIVTYLQKCKNSITHGGLIIVKENMSTTGEDVFDELDSSVTRKDESFRSIFNAAGVEIKKTEIQRGLPKELYPVRIYALVLTS